MQLVIVRHAHAQNHGPTIDHSRPLSEHGHAQAHETASFLRSHHIEIDYAIISDAVRTTETFANLDIQTTVEYSKRAYNASANTLAELITEVPNDCESIMIVAHNPGITDLAISCGYNDVMSTGTAVIVEWDGISLDFTTADKHIVAAFSPS
jgi:phosphohistidine phosphatase